MAYVDKLANKNNEEMYSLVKQDLLEKTVGSKGMKTKFSLETVRAIFKMTTGKNHHEKFRVNKGRNFAGEFEKTFHRWKYSSLLRQRVRLWLHLLSVRNAQWKLLPTIIWPAVDTSTFTKRFFFSKPVFLEEKNWYSCNRRSSDFAEVCLLFPAKNYEK